MSDLIISRRVTIPDAEISWHATASQGAGGQKINKTASAVHLFFDIPASSLPADIKTLLMATRDHRITAAGLVVIKAQSERSREANLAAARKRLAELIAAAGQPAKKRRPTRPSRAARKRRTDNKTKRGRVKALRGRPGGDS